VGVLWGEGSGLERRWGGLPPRSALVWSHYLYGEGQRIKIRIVAATQVLVTYVTCRPNSPLLIIGCVFLVSVRQAARPAE
jgi:hypothetical protein